MYFWFSFVSVSIRCVFVCISQNVYGFGECLLEAAMETELMRFVRMHSFYLSTCVNLTRHLIALHIWTIDTIEWTPVITIERKRESERATERQSERESACACACATRQTAIEVGSIADVGICCSVSILRANCMKCSLAFWAVMWFIELCVCVNC